MGFKRTTEGRVFFQGANSNEAPEEYDFDEEIVPAKKPPKVETPPPVKAEGSKADMTAEVVALLKSLNDKLQDTQEERDTIRRELAMQRARMSELETQAEESGRISAELKAAREQIKELENRAETNSSALDDRYKSIDQIKKRQQVLETMQREQQQKLANQSAYAVKMARRVEETEEKQEAFVDRLEETAEAQQRLVRQIDKAIQDRSRMMRKMERIEETVLQTRDVLNANAQLFFSQGAASNVPLIEGNEGSGEKPREEPILLSQKIANLQPKSWWQTIDFNRAASVALLVCAGLVGGVFFSQIDKTDMPAFDKRVTSEISELIVTPERVAEKRVEPLEEVVLPQQSTREYTPANPDEALENDIGALDLEDSESLLEAMERDADALAARFNDMDVGEVTEDYQEAPVQENTKTEIPVESNLYDVMPDPSLPAVIKEIERQAFDGNAEAQHDLAAIYTAGHGGVKQDYARAAYWFEQAAKGGVANAGYNLGVLYHQGIGVHKDLEKALDWYKSAAELNHPEAQYNLGIAYIEGVGVEYNPQRAETYFINAAAAGIMEAAYNLGLIHENGLLGEAKPDEALKWYKRAADQGSPEAKAALEQLARSLDMPLEDVNRLVDGVGVSGQTNNNISNVVEKVSFAKPVINEEQKKVNTRESAQRYLTAEIQKYLMLAGLYPGPADGFDSPLVEDAVRTYQIENGLKANGDITNDLLVHMKGLGMNSGYFDQGSREE